MTKTKQFHGRYLSLTSSLHSFLPNVAFHIETRHLFCSANQMPGFYMKRNTTIKCVNPFLVNVVPFLLPLKTSESQKLSNLEERMRGVKVTLP